MIAGILLGPSVLGRIPGFSETFFPPASIPRLNMVAQIGLVLFMFLVGLEIDIDFIRSKGKLGTFLNLNDTVSVHVFFDNSLIV
jgi:Kef-type K+ transport system membrane component KefB